jgi:mRNA-degrading endonuclease toxin of MazEF toxin-antitoxin module
MLVVQNDANNARMTNTIVVFITTNLSRAHEPTQVLVDVNTVEGKTTGLTRNSVVSCENILTIHQSDVIRAIGRFSGGLMAEVNVALKASLGL